MTFSDPTWAGILPGEPKPFFLESGQGERSAVFDSLVTVLLSGNETQNQFGMFTLEAPAGRTIVSHTHEDVHEIFYVIEGKVKVFVEDHEGNQEARILTPGDFGYVPATYLHAFRAEGDFNKILGVCTAGFERFFQALGKNTDDTMPPMPPYIPSPEQMGQAFGKFSNIPKFDQEWKE